MVLQSTEQMSDSAITPMLLPVVAHCYPAVNTVRQPPLIGLSAFACWLYPVTYSLSAVTCSSVSPKRCHQVPWKGSLPPLSAHGRDYPSEEACYDKLDAPVTVTGSVCRADWVDGTTGRCRTLTEGGDKRTDGWTPQGCIICNTLEASPCRDTYKMCVPWLLCPPLCCRA